MTGTLITLLVSIVGFIAIVACKSGKSLFDK